MQAAMDRLDGFTRRHGRIVAIAWLVVLLAALPFAARQTEHLTSGGFEVPGSGSAAVERGLAAFDGAQREQLAVVLARRPGARDADVQAALARVRSAAGQAGHAAPPRDAAVRAAVAGVRAAAGKVGHAALAPDAAARAAQRAGRAPITVVPLALSGSQDDAANAAADMRRELNLDDGQSGAIELHLVGQ